MSKETAIKTIKWTYKVLRSIIFSAIIFVVVAFAALYGALSIPPVQNFIKERLEKELSGYIGSKVSINSLNIRPLNEIIINGAEIYDQNKEKCLEIGELGAGINLWRLILSQEIEITYVELLDFTASIYQAKDKEPLNIDFIIKAFQPKDKNKPPTKFDLKIHNIVVRNGAVRFERRWKPRKTTSTFDANYISLSNLNADITIPKLSNDFSEVDLRRLSLNEKSGLQINEIGGDIFILPELIDIRDLKIRFPESQMKLKKLKLPLNIFKDLNLLSEPINVSLYDSKITPSNFSAFYAPLERLDETYPIELTIEINPDFINIENFEIENNANLNLRFRGEIENYLSREEVGIRIEDLNLSYNSSSIHQIVSMFPDISNNILLGNMMDSIGNTKIDIKGDYFNKTKELNLVSDFTTSLGNFNISGSCTVINPENLTAKVNIEIPSLKTENLLPNFKLKEIINGKINIVGDFNLKAIKNSDGNLELTVDELDLYSRSLANIHGSVSKLRNQIDGNLTIEDVNLDGSLDVSVLLDGKDSEWRMEANLYDFDTYNSFLEEDISSGYEIKGLVNAYAKGNSIDNISGNLTVSDLYVKKWNGKELNINSLTFDLQQNDDSERIININSDIADINISGHFIPSRFKDFTKEILGQVCPTVFDRYETPDKFGEGKFEIAIKDAEPLIDFFSLPIFPLTELSIEGTFDSENNHLELFTDIPYIQQGKNKLITDTYLRLDVTGDEGKSYLGFGTIYPTKKGLLKLDMDLHGQNGIYDIIIDFNRNRNVIFSGELALKILLEKSLSNIPDVTAYVLPTQFYLNDDTWDVEEAEILFRNDILKIDNFCIRHADQYVNIYGSNTKAGEGEIRIDLSDINLDNIFETLNIPHVNFGGNATGNITAKQIFSSDPDIKTEKLIANNLSYNGAVIGNGDLRAKLNLPAKMIEIGALIKEDDQTRAIVDGGVWFGKDSLAFKFDAFDVNVGFMQPFMQAFSSSVKGRASVEALLYGNFSDIDMTGKIVANNTEILIDYINASYTGSDTVYLYPGKIEIPHIRLKDKYGNTALVEGTITHRYFHEPVFNFLIKDMDNLLVYDTNAKLNNLWYGKIFASGAGEIKGRPGLVTIAADVETGPGSDFTFVLSDQQEAVKSHFLSFSDKRKERYEASLPKDTVPEFLKRFQQNQTNKPEEHDIYSMDFRVSVTDDIRFNLIMDPIGGDKIVAYGSGAMNMTYSSLTDELKLYGKYTLDKGTYNFTLQDIILKDFTIKPGSSIAFTGDPYSGMLNITAAYRVNTSLTELDQSFAHDRELNRTSVPVEALLKVTGMLTNPHIGFDIELPTVTEETAQKVRSIISTDDMMSKEVLYLVALNKFYPPEYMTTTNSGGEWASIASSTLSSQLQNMIGQITDKFTLAPSIRSDKGDFSDIEVDIALSSQLFNNRLLLNGNVGYRDPSNSSTTFVGDFDLEYLLNKKGTWRLKAYNHFNDQNYYLKSALTTQGIGIVWRKEFGLPRKKENKTQNIEEEIVIEE